MIFAAPIVERHALQSGTLQHFDVASLLVCNRQDRVSERQTGSLDVLRIVAEVGRDLLPCRVKGLTDRFQSRTFRTALGVWPDT
jgi:hypothetical protein